MEIDPKSQKAEALGNLYRAALFMIKGQTDLSFSFLGKAHHVLGKKLSKTIIQLMNTNGKSIDEKNRLFWAEKILDQYKIMKRQNYLTSSNR